MNPLPTPLSNTTAFSPLPETPLTTQSIDLFWRNRSTIGPMAGRNVLWGMAGPEYGGSFKDLTPVADANWSVAAVADYNRDGASDYLWRNQAASMSPDPKARIRKLGAAQVSQALKLSS